MRDPQLGRRRRNQGFGAAVRLVVGPGGHLDENNAPEEVLLQAESSDKFYRELNLLLGQMVFDNMFASEHEFCDATDRAANQNIGNDCQRYCGNQQF